MVTVLLLSAAIAHAADYDFEADGIYYKNPVC